MKRILFPLVLLLMTSVINAEEIPVETFFKFPDITSVKISPDGKHLAATVESDGQKRLAIVDLKAMKIKHIFNFNSGKRQIGSYGWLNNERVYARMELKIGPLAIPYQTGYLFAGNINGKKSVQLMPGPSRKGSTDFPRNFSVISYLPHDDKHILIALRNRDYTSAYKLNVYRGTKRKVETSPEKYGSLLADHTGALRVSTSSDGIEEIYKIHIKESEDSEWKLLKEYHGKGVGLTPLTFSSDNKKLIAHITDAGKSRGIYSIDLRNGEQELLKEIPGDASISGYVEDNNYFSPELIAIKRMPGFVETDYIKPNHIVAKVVRSLKKSFPKQEVEITNFTQDGKTALVRVWSDKNPSAYYLFDMGKFKLKFMLKTLPWIDRKKMNPMQPVSFEARDGKEIRGYITLPYENAKNVPMVVMVHGGPYGPSDKWQYNPETQFLANRGYAVLQINYRGSGGRGAKFQYSAYKQMGAEMQDDLTDGTLWAIKQGFAAKDRVCIYGGSYGGYAALMGVIREPDLYKCSIGYVGVYDIEEWKNADTWRFEGGRKFVKEAWGIDDPAFVKERSPVHNVSKIKVPVMLVHGGKDPRVPVGNYHSLIEEFEKHGVEYQTLLKTYEGHGFADYENIVDLYSQMENFLEKHIGK